MIVTLNELPVLSLRLSLPLVGPWTAHAETSEPDEETNSIVLSDGTFRLNGTAKAVGASGSRRRYSIVGGAGGLPRAVEARSYTETTLREVAESITVSAGEVLSAAPATNIPYWTHPAKTGSECLTQLVEAHGLSWRVLDDGRVWVGEETWPIFEHGPLELDVDPVLGLLELAIEDLSLRPGVTLLRKRVTRVEYLLNDKLRVHAYTE